MIQLRDDLSTATPREQPPPLALFTQIRVQPGGQQSLEELIRKVTEASIKLDESRQTLVSQVVIGDLNTYGIAQPLDDLGELDGRRTPQELLLAAFGEAEAQQIFQSAAAQIREVTTTLSTYRPDLSNA